MTFKVETSEKGTLATDVQVQVPVEEAESTQGFSGEGGWCNNGEGGWFFKIPKSSRKERKVSDVNILRMYIKMFFLRLGGGVCCHWSLGKNFF